MQYKKIIIGTRGSKLAIWQAQWVKSSLLALYPRLSVELRIIKTTGDIVFDTPLSEIPDNAFFTREIENHLLDGSIDLAVHSLKDLPAESTPGLRLAAVTARVDPADVLISKGDLTLEQLPKNAVILTGAPRRRAQLLHYRPDLHIADVRGNVPTRLRKLDESNAHALIIAAAGLIRLDLQSRITQRLAPADFPPAPGQGALALEIRSDDTATAELLISLNDHHSRCATTAERTVLSHLRAGCRVPIGAYARIEDRELSLLTQLFDTDGQNLLTACAAGPTESPEQLGRLVAQQLLDQGARKILDNITS